MCCNCASAILRATSAADRAATPRSVMMKMHFAARCALPLASYHDDSTQMMHRTQLNDLRRDDADAADTTRQRRAHFAEGFSCIDGDTSKISNK